MKKIISISFLAIFASTILVAQTDYFKDTVWTRQTDQKQGFYMVKFSNNDSIIVAHGYEMDLFFNTQTGQEIGRIPFNAEVHFFNNDRNFIMISASGKMLEIWDVSTFSVIDSLEKDSLSINSILITKNEQNIIGIVTGGFRIWNLATRRITKTKILNFKEDNLIGWGFGRLILNCDNSQIIAGIAKNYLNPSTNKTYIRSSLNVFDFNTLDSINTYPSIGDYKISNTCKYIAYKTSDMNFGIEIYDFNTKQLIKKLNLNGLNITGIEFSPDDKYIVTSTEIKIWDLDSLKLVHYYQSGTANNFAISHNSKLVVSSTGNFLITWYGRFQTSPVINITDTINFIYPNPTTGKITVQFIQPGSEVTSIILSDINGNPIQSLANKFIESGKQSIELDVSSYSSGTYIIRVQNQHLSNIYKLIIIK